MAYAFRLLILTASLGIVAVAGQAQPPNDRKGDAPKPSAKGGSAADAIVARMMAFDKNKDGQLTRDEITDERLLRLFDRADTNKDGIVTKEELVALANKMAAEDGPQGGGRGGPGDGPGGMRRGPGGPGGGPGGPGGRGPGGRGGPGGGPGGPGGGPGGFGPPRPGEILPGFMQQALNLNAKQKQQLESLQKEVTSKLEKILTEEQKQQLKEMHDRRPGGPGGPGGRPGDGPGGPGGRPGDGPGE